MARLPRLVLPGLAHSLIQRGHGSRAVFENDDDRQSYLEALREAASVQKVAVHAYALRDDAVQLLVTPPQAAALSQMVQAVGRRYVSAHNRRYGRSGTLWEGRFRCAVIERGPWTLAALRWIDGQPAMTSAPHRAGGARSLMLVDPPEFWALGNTPFEREAAYRVLQAQGIAPEEAEALGAATVGGWALGSPSFIQQLAVESSRPVRPRPRGRPPRR